jgi:membrane-associated progesterone receptor component
MSVLQFPLNKILAQIQTNPINWSLLTILGIMVYNLFTSEESKNYQIQTKPPGPPKSVEFKDYTAQELQPFSGEDNTPVYMGVLGEVFDVSSGRNFYGPGKCKFSINSTHINRLFRWPI